MSESESNSEEEENGKKSNAVKLRPDQFEVLAKHRNLGCESEVISPEEKRVLDMLAIDAEAVNEMNNPTVVDRRGLSRDTVTDSLEALHSLRDPVVAEREDVEALGDCERGLREVVAGSLGVDREVVESMGARPLADFIQHASEDDQPKLSTLSQTPESGGSPEINPSAATPDGVEALGAGERNDLEQLVDKHELLKDRLPKRSDEIKRECLEMVPGVDEWDELKREIE